MEFQRTQVKYLFYIFIVAFIKIKNFKVIGDQHLGDLAFTILFRKCSSVINKLSLYSILNMEYESDTALMDDVNVVPPNKLCSSTTFM